jgi:hypothetical protein
VGESSLRAERMAILQRNNAQEILQALAMLEEQREEFATRWIWELIQNARDFPDDSRPMRIRMRDKKGVRKPFEFELDRSGDDADEVGDAMQRSFDELERSLGEGSLKPGDWTKYVYQTDGGTGLESQFPSDTLPYILLFDDKVNAIELQFGGQGTAYARARSEELTADSSVTTIEGSDGLEHFVVLQGEDICTAIPVTEQAGGSYALCLPGDVPRFFKFLPLVSSAGVGIPAVFHSPAFSVTENRDGLMFGTSGSQGDRNKELLDEAADCLLRLARTCAEAGFGYSYLLLDLEAVSDAPAWMGDREWYLEWQRSIARELAKMPLVPMQGEEIAALTDVDLPLGDDVMEWKKVYELDSVLAPDRVPMEAHAQNCSVLATKWTKLLGEADPLIQQCVLTPNRLIKRVRDTQSLEGLGARIELDAAETVEWLNTLIVAVAEGQRGIMLNGLMSDQTPQGIFRSFSELYRAPDIAEDLKDVLEKLGDPVRERLVREGITGIDSVVKAVQKREPLVASAKDLLKKRVPATPDKPEYGEACLTMFQWLAAESLWSDLKDGIPVYTLDSDGTEILSKTSSRGPALLAPRELWPEKARGYWDVFPKGSVLSDDYAAFLDSSTWSEAAAHEVVIGELLWSEEQELDDLEKYTRDLELDGNGHCAESPLEIGRLAFVGSSELYDALRGSRTRAARFLQFILDYVVHADESWKQIVWVRCKCGKDHQIIPCEWLAWIRDRDWVPRARGSERLGDASLAWLTKHDARLADIVTREEHAEFLNLLGINVLEQALLAVGEAQGAELRRRFAQLARLAGRHPDAVARLLEDIETHHEANQRWQENQKLGKMVESLIEAQLKTRLSPAGIRVKTQFRGYDLGAYVGDPSSTDVGSIEVQSRTLLAKIEIKTTRGNTVSMSNLQGEGATNDQARFWLCVVPLDSDQELDELTPELVEKAACFVSDIGSRLAPAREEIREAVASADASGFDLEHVDDIRFGIRSEIWDDEAMSLSGFVDMLNERALRERRSPRSE